MHKYVHKAIKLDFFPNMDHKFLDKLFDKCAEVIGSIWMAFLHEIKYLQYSKYVLNGKLNVLTLCLEEITHRLEICKDVNKKQEFEKCKNVIEYAIEQFKSSTTYQDSQGEFASLFFEDDQEDDSDEQEMKSENIKKSEEKVENKQNNEFKNLISPVKSKYIN